jgi:hypothetical protein
MKVPVTGDIPIRITPRGGAGLVLYQGTSFIRMTNADVLAFVDAVVETAQQNATRNRQQDEK